jgi:3D (Asp-Asp-Asp) domain-containing protein
VGRGSLRWGTVFVVVLCGALFVVGGPAFGRSNGATAYTLQVDAVAYSLPGSTALGIPVRRGVVAVDPRLIPLGTKLHVPGYGKAVAADVGVAIRGRIIDLWFPTLRAARSWGRRTVTITVYR